MSIRPVAGFLKLLNHLRRPFERLLLVAGVMILLAGCASSMSKVETWQGSPAAADKAATLKTPGAIQVARVNGRNMTSFLMDDLPLNYALLPGENEVVFSYKTIWAKSGVVENGESKVHVYESSPQVVRFTADEDAVYRFQLPQPGSRSEAEQVASDFSATLVAEDGQVVATSSAWEPSQASERTPVPASGKAGAEVTEGSALDRLKSVWATATEEEKKAFLRWAFE